MKKILFINLLITCFFTLSLTGQSNPNWEYWVTGNVEIKSGMAAELEKVAGLKTKKFNNTPETAITTYKIMNGPDQGKYQRIQGYKDLNWFNSDMTSKAGRQYWMKNVSKYVQNYEGRKVWWRIENLSHNFGTETKAKKYIHRLIRIIKPGKTNDFWTFSNRIIQVFKKHEYTGVQAAFKIVSGGNENEFIFVYAFDDFTEQGKFPNTDKSLKELYNEMYNGSYDKDLDVYNDAIEMSGRRRETLSLIPKLSTEL